MTTDKGGYTENELSVLTAEERAALDTMDDEANADDGGDADPEGDAAAQDKSAATEGDAGTETNDGDTKEQDAKPDPSAAKATPNFPSFAAPANAEATLNDIQSKVDRLDEAFDLGEITAAEHRAQTRELAAEERSIRDSLLMAQMSEQAKMQAYQATVGTFLATHTEYEPGSQMYHFLDTELRRLQNKAITEGRDGLDPALITEAHQSLRALIANSERTTPAEPAAKDAAKPQVPPRRELPPSLGAIPAADMQNVTDGVFAAMQKLDGLEYEAAFARLSDAQRDAYLSRAN
jgi:hypothetical protein